MTTPGTDTPVPEVDRSSGGTLRSVANMLDVLKAFGRSPEWRLSDLARELGLSKSVVHRLLRTLVEGGFVLQDRERGTYLLGMEVVKIARSAERRGAIARVAAPRAERLSHETGDTVTIAVLRGHRGLCVTHVEAPDSLLYPTQIGDTIFLHASALGYALLAYQPPSLIDGVLSQSLPHFTGTTLTDRGEIEAELERTRARGYGFSAGTMTPGARAVAAPIRDIDGNVTAAIGLTAPADMMPDEDVPRLGALVVDVAQELSRELGHVEPDELAEDGA